MKKVVLILTLVITTYNIYAQVETFTITNITNTDLRDGIRDDIDFWHVLSVKKDTIYKTFKKINDNKNLNSNRTYNRKFLDFEIPAVLNGANIDQAANSNAGFDFTDKKASLKLGFPFNRPNRNATFKYTGFVGANFGASDKIATIFKADEKFNLDGGLNAGFSFMARHTKWFYTDALEIPVPTYDSLNICDNANCLYPTRIYTQKVDTFFLINDSLLKHNISSESVTWINVTGGFDNAAYRLLNNATTATFGNLLADTNIYTWQAFVAANYYFYSEIPRYNIWSIITSIGIGVAKQNNIGKLSKRNWQEGTLVYNADSTKYQAVTESKEGYIGTFHETTGLAMFGEFFKPILRMKSDYLHLYWGNRVLLYNIGNPNFKTDVNTGLYFNIKQLTKTKEKKDVINFAIIANFNDVDEAKNINNRAKNENTDSYWKKNFSITVQASLPLRF